MELNLCPNVLKYSFIDGSVQTLNLHELHDVCTSCFNECLRVCGESVCFVCFCFLSGYHNQWGTCFRNKNIFGYVTKQISLFVVGYHTQWSFFMNNWCLKHSKTNVQPQLYHLFSQKSIIVKKLQVLVAHRIYIEHFLYLWSNWCKLHIKGFHKRFWAEQKFKKKRKTTGLSSFTSWSLVYDELFGNWLR